MATIMLFGSSTIKTVPQTVVDWLYEYNKQGHKFIVGDKKGAETDLHRALSSSGASVNTQLYSMGKSINNRFEITNKIFDTYYDEGTKTVQIVLRGAEEGSIDESFKPYEITGVEKEMDIQGNSEYYNFKYKQMIKDCDIAIGVVTADDKVTTHIIQWLNIYNKPCYLFNM